MAKNTNKKPQNLQETLKRNFSKASENGKGKSRAVALYVVACIWLLTAIINFLIGQQIIAAVFVGMGFLTILFAFYADWKENRRAKK